MKGVIVDIKGKYAVALTRDGSFVKVKSRNSFTVGAEVDFTPAFQVNSHLAARVASIAAAFIFAVGIGWGAYAMPYSYVDMDINPSVELTSNIFDRIIKVEALNPDGKKISDSLSLKNMKLENGIAELLDQAVNDGYIEEGDLDAVIFSVIARNEDKTNKLEAKLKAQIETEFADSNSDSVAIVKKFSIEKQKEAKQKGITPGKLSLIEKLIEQNPEIDINDLKDVSVKDIMKSLKQEKAEDKGNDNKSDNEGKKETGEDIENNKDKDKGKDKDISKNNDKDDNKYEHKEENKDEDKKENSGKNDGIIQEQKVPTQTSHELKEKEQKEKELEIKEKKQYDSETKEQENNGPELKSQEQKNQNGGNTGVKSNKKFDSDTGSNFGNIPANEKQGISEGNGNSNSDSAGKHQKNEKSKEK